MKHEKTINRRKFLKLGMAAGGSALALGAIPINLVADDEVSEDEPLAQAIDAGITVVNIDVALDETAKEEAGVELAFFGPDNRAGAKLAGDELGKALGEGGKVVILEGNPEADNAVQRQLL